MTPIVPALAGALMVAGVIGVIVGLTPTAPRPAKPPWLWRARATARWARVGRRTRLLLLAGVIVGLVVAATTGWLLGLLAIPAAVVGIPYLISAPEAGARIEKLQALEDWTRALAGVLTVGVGLEQALIATLRSTPEAIRPEVTALVARLRARWGTEAAIRAFADDLNDATGDVVAASLILGARRRGAGLAAVLQSLAETVADDVRARRAIEADRAKPRATARWVTLITVSVLGVLAVTGEYVRPYTTGIGQVLLFGLLGAYVLVLVWMKRMAEGAEIHRILARADEAPLGRSGR